MSMMPLHITWWDVALRLALSVLAGALFGLNRDESGKVAGLRTTLLVCIAACVAMLQVNVLLPQAGKQPESFAVLDLMRLPLGILSGVGFIGAGAILRQDGRIKGVTTAATLWIVTVVGLCFGGGQIGLGLIASIVGIIVLWFFKVLEEMYPRRKSALLTVEYHGEQYSQPELIDALQRAGCHATPVSAAVRPSPELCEDCLEVRWHGTRDAVTLPPLLAMSMAAGASRARWALNG
jgi:putative Mg2+ transporter-C (MgtC) family protein